MTSTTFWLRGRDSDVPSGKTNADEVVVFLISTISYGLAVESPPLKPSVTIASPLAVPANDNDGREIKARSKSDEGNRRFPQFQVRFPRRVDP